MQITCSTSNVYHMQHVVCHLVERDSSAVNLDRVEITFILALFDWLKSLTDEEGAETEVPRKIALTNLRKCHILKPENLSPNRDSTRTLSMGGKLGKHTY